MVPEAIRKVKLVVVGDGAVGKTCLFHRYANKSWPEYRQTIFDAFADKAEVDGKVVLLQLFDADSGYGNDRLRPLQYPGTDVFLVCFSIATPSSLENVRLKWFPEVRRHCPAVPVILVATKLDLREEGKTIAFLERDGKSPTTFPQGQRMKTKIGAVRYIECSSRTPENVETVFAEAIRAALATPDPAKQRRCHVV